MILLEQYGPFVKDWYDGKIIKSLSILLGLGMSLGACATPPDLSAIETTLKEMDPAPERLQTTLKNSAFVDAVQHAVLTSPRAARSEANTLEHRASWLDTQNAFAPELSIGLGAGTDDGSFFIPYVSIHQKLFDAGQSRAEQTAARARLLGSEFNRADQLGLIALEAINAWANTATTDRIAQVTAESVARLEQTASQIETRTAAGVGSEIDVLTARSSIENERASLISARSEQERARARFSQIYGVAAAQKLALPPHAPTLRSGLLAKSNVMHAAQAEVLAAEADMAAAKAGRLPQIAIGASADDIKNINGGLRSDYLLSPARSRTQRVAASEARLAARRADLNALEKDLSAQTMMLAVDIKHAATLLQTAQHAADANRENRELAYKQFETGGTTLSALIDLEREALQAEVMLLHAEHQARMVGWEALFQSGDILGAIQFDLPDICGVKLDHPDCL